MSAWSKWTKNYIRASSTKNRRNTGRSTNGYRLSLAYRQLLPEHGDEPDAPLRGPAHDLRGGDDESGSDLHDLGGERAELQSHRLQFGRSRAAGDLASQRAGLQVCSDR